MEEGNEKNHTSFNKYACACATGPVLGIMRLGAMKKIRPFILLKKIIEKLLYIRFVLQNYYLKFYIQYFLTNLIQ